jgi:hypothetical protein
MVQFFHVQYSSYLCNLSQDIQYCGHDLNQQVDMALL